MSLSKQSNSTIMKQVDPLHGHMHVTSMDMEGLGGLEKEIMALPKKLYEPNSRQPENKGQVHFGWTNMAGPQTQAVCGEQMPYLSVPYKYLVEKKPALFAMLMNAIECMWARAVEVFPVECAHMLRTAASLRLGSTGFHKISSATNFAALWHKDNKNLTGGIQCVLVLGVFVGGEVRFDVAGRVGKNRSNNTKSKGREEDVVIVPNQHGTLFIGRYGTVWHAVNEVTDGNRTIVAAYAVQKVADFAEAMQGRYSFEQALDVWRHRVTAVKWMALSEPDLKKREIVRHEHTSAWKAGDLARDRE